MKTCTKCGEAKPLTEFYANAGARDGRRNDCKACVLEDRRKAYAERPAMRARSRAQRRAWHLEHRATTPKETQP
ncbi:MAG: hypothetical protein U0R80_08000 [Nocardioidaceae bacterium]